MLSRLHLIPERYGRTDGQTFAISRVAGLPDGEKFLRTCIPTD